MEDGRDRGRDGLGERPRSRPGRVRPGPPRWRRPTLLLTTAATVIVAVLAASVVLPGGDRGPGRLPGGIDIGPRTATAAD